MRQIFYLMLIAGFLLVEASALAGSKEEMALRLNFGIKIFPYILATDSRLPTKVNESGSLLILFVYRTEGARAERLKRKVSKCKGSKNVVSIRAEITDDFEKKVAGSVPPAGIFLSEYLPDETFQRIVDFGIRNNVIVFSPIIGDVKRGATAGIHIGTGMMPSLNLTTLKKSRIHIGKKLRKLSKKYK